METPSSTRRVTRSMTKAAPSSIPNSKKFEESEKNGTKGKQRNGQQMKERSALFEITNDSSPIIGLAMETPSSMVSKKRVNFGQKTPGSGEALLRGQVKNLLQKVEEEADFSKFSLDSKRTFLHLQGLVNSPMGLLAPTPANTPHLNPSEYVIPSVTPSPVEDKFIISQMVIGKKEASESEESKLTRSLLLDFSEKSEGSDSSGKCSSMLTYESDIIGAENDDASSVWSIQVNASTKDEDEESKDETLDEEEVEEEFDDYYEDVENVGMIEELCQGISKIGINGGAKFAGKHTRFVYNSDGEMEEEEESGGALHLKGLPTPKGKHIRFPEEEN